MKKLLFIAVFSLGLFGCTPEPANTNNTNNSNNMNNANNVNNVNNANNTNNASNINNVNNLNNINNANNTNNANNNNQLKIFQSGTRIKMKVGTTADGSKEFKNWYDTQLNIDCSFTYDVNGTLRCLPRSYANLAYSDSSCTMPIALSSCPLSAGTYFVAYDMSVTCLNFGQYGARGFLVSSASNGQYYLLSSGNCGGPYNNTSGYHLYNAQEVAPSQFAEQIISIE